MTGSPIFFLTYQTSHIFLLLNTWKDQSVKRVDLFHMKIENLENFLCNFCFQYVMTDIREFLEQVATLYSKFGIKSNTMDDVAGELGISKKTLYQSFKDKDELVNKVMDFLYHKRHNEIIKISTTGLNVIEEMYQIYQQIISMLKEYSNVMMNDLRKYYYEKHTAIIKKYKQLLEDIIVGNIERGKDEGLYRQTINSRIIAKSHVAMVMNLPENNVISIGEYTSKGFSDELFEYHLRGLINEKSIEISNSFLKIVKQNKTVDHEGSQIN